MEKKNFTFNQIKHKLADYCVYQDRCHFEVEQKMREFDLIPEAHDEIIIYLIQNNFLNEERFARSFARGKFYQKKWGKRKIANALRQKGVPKNLVEKGFEEIEEEDYLKTLEELSEKKWQQIKAATIWEKRKKLQSFLQQRGFEWELIKMQLEQLS